MMSRPVPRFYFDYVDPLSYLVEREVQAAEAAGSLVVERVPAELCPPDRAMLDPDGAPWRDRLARAEAVAAKKGVVLTPPALLPWTHKAHELVLHARASDRGGEMHRRIFAAVFEEGRDIGRIDVLVELAQKAGFDFTEIKATLDVDRYAEALDGIRAATAEEGIVEIPTLTLGARRLEGFHNRDAIGTFLHATDT